MLSTALASKPIMRIEDGKIELAAKTRTQTKAFSRLVELILEGAEGEPVFVAIQENEARESGRRLSEMLEEVLPEGSTVMMVELSDVLAVHAGPGSLGVSVVYSNHLKDLDLGL